MQGWFNIHTPTSVIHHIDKREDKNHMIISLVAEKIDKVQHSFMIKTFIKVSMEGTYLTIMKTI